MADKGSILLVEDDKNMGFILSDYLELSGFEVTHCEDGELGLTAFRKNVFDLCLLDVMMPIKDGFTLAEEIRKENPDMPIIFLTAKSMKEDRIKGLRIGADDYMTKPFSTEELILRIEAILRRYSISKTKEQGTSVYSIGIMRFDFSNQLLISGKEERRLTKRESEVLRMLCESKNEILRREVALKAIWGEDDYFMGRSMDVYITKLRKYLKADPNIQIKNIHGTGFKLEITKN